MTTTTVPYRIIGTSPIRPDGIEKVTGQAQFAADVHLPGMLHARLKRSPHAHALLRRIDVSKALALPGVEAVVTADDFPDPRASQARRFLIGNFIAVDKVVFYGQPVAAVAATSPHIAEDAMDLIEVEYEELPPVMNALDAMLPGAPILHEDLQTSELFGTRQSTDEPTNVASHLELMVGDPDGAFATADVVFDDEFRTSTWHQGYIEPHSATVQWRADGSLIVYSSSQGSFQVVREPLGEILGIPPSRIRVVPMEVGGGFGGKNRIYCEPIAAVLARKAGKPVKLTMTREEVIQATGPTGGVYIRAKLGAMQDGTIVAFTLWMAYEAGGFPGSSVGGGVNTSLGQYSIPNVRIDGYDVLVNRPRNAAYRAPGVPQPNFAIESLVDELAGRLEMDPIDLRIKNAAREGTRRPNGVVITSNGHLEVLEQVKNHPHYRSELSGPNHGRGVAIGFWNAGSGAHSMNATVNADGTVMLNAAAIDLGGGLRATEAMTVAEVLGIPYEDVRPRMVDTDSIGYTTISAGSGTGSGASASAYRVATEIRDRMVERAARIWEVAPSEVSYDQWNGILTGPAAEGGQLRSLTFKQLAAQQGTTGGYISGHADLGGAQGGPTFAGHIVDVEVDRDTGKVRIVRYTVVQDVGRAMHLLNVEGQIEGGAAQGIGMALYEEYSYDEQGRLRNSSLLDYRQPTALDIPMIDTVLVECPNPAHPLGVRGIGEMAIVPPLGAIANAIHSATGIRVHSLPATPRALLREMLTHEDESRG